MSSKDTKTRQPSVDELINNQQPTDSPVTETDVDTDGVVENQTAGEELSIADQLAQEQTRAENNWADYLRAVAELENLRKRAQRDVEQAHKFAIERFANEMLIVKDSLEMGLAAAQGADTQDIAAKLLEGKQMTLKQLETSFEKFGIEVLDPKGQPFDPELHEAMAMQPSADHAPGTVMTVVQKGYCLKGRLLRPARVLVAQETQQDG